MKKIINILAIATVFGAALTGCNKTEESGVSGNKEIRFSARVGSFQVKATDTAFENGDAIGLFADDPVYVENVKLTFSDGVLTPETPIYWGDHQMLEQPTYFYAYYPYTEEFQGADGRYVNVCVAEDQSTHEALTASDFMVAKAQNSPADGTVQLNFAHAFSKLVFTVENLVDDAKVKDIYLGNVYLGGWVAIGEVTSAWTDWTEGTIKTAPVTLPTRADTAEPEGTDAWVAIIPPQDTAPMLLIEMEDGRTFTYNTNNDFLFQPSRRYNAHITIDTTTVSADFSCSISDWLDNDDIQFGQFVDVGDWFAYMASDYFWMEADGLQVRYFHAEYHEGDSVFFLSAEGGSYGVAEATAGNDGYCYAQEGVTYTLVKYGNGLVLPCEGYWCISINPAKGTAWVAFEGEFEHPNRGWSLIGTINGTNWNVDFPMEESGDYAIYDLEYNEGEEFKLRRYNDWSINRGLGRGEPYMAWDGFMDYMTQDGGNIMLPQSGLWHIVYNPVEDIVSFSFDPGYTLDDLQWVTMLNDGTAEVEVTQVVYAVSTNGFVLFDGKYGIFVYTSSEPGVAIGDVVHVTTSTKTTYNAVPELKDAQYEIVAQVSADEMIDLTYMYNEVQSLDSTIAQIALPIYVEGVIGADGKTLTKTGNDCVMRAYYTPESYGLADLVNHNVRLCGFYNGIYSATHNIIVTAVEDLGEVEEPEQPEMPENTVYLALEKADLAALADGNTAVALDNVITFKNSSSYSGTVTELRIYKNQTLTLIAAEGYEILLVELCCEGNGSAKYGPGLFYNGAPDGYYYSDDSSNGLWYGNSSQLEFTAVDGQVRIDALKVGYAPVQ